MSSSRDSRGGYALHCRLQREFIGTTAWPPDRAALTALVDLGLSDDRIAVYFGVTPSQVARLREIYLLHLPKPPSQSTSTK